MRSTLRLCALLLATGCGALLEEPPLEDAGRACTQESDCVPDGCCGLGTGATHRLDAPSCAGMTCSGMCPQNQVRCGCGMPICRDNRCSVAVASGPGCE